VEFLIWWQLWWQLLLRGVWSPQSTRQAIGSTKPVDRVGEAITAEERVPPQSVKLPDPKSGELVDFFFLIRLTRFPQASSR